MCASCHLSFRDVEGVSVEIHSCLSLYGGHILTWAIWQHCRAFLKILFANDGVTLIINNFQNAFVSKL